MFSVHPLRRKQRELAEKRTGPRAARERLPIRQCRAGRTVCSAAKPRDPLVLRAYGKVTFEPSCLEDFVGKETPLPEQVIFRVDVPEFLSSLPRRNRNLALDLASGMSTTEAAEKYGLSAGRISQFRREFKALFDRFFEE